MIDRIRRHFLSKLGKEVLATVEAPNQTWRLIDAEIIGSVLLSNDKNIVISLRTGYAIRVPAFRTLHLREYERKVIAKAAAKVAEKLVAQ